MANLQGRVALITGCAGKLGIGRAMAKRLATDGADIAISVFAQDATVAGGSIEATHGLKMYHTLGRALDMRMPFIGLYDSLGARTQKPWEKGGARRLSRTWSLYSLQLKLIKMGAG